MVYNPSSSMAQPRWRLQNNLSLEVLFHCSFMGAFRFPSLELQQDPAYRADFHVISSVLTGSPGSSQTPCGTMGDLRQSPLCPAPGCGCGAFARASPSHPGRHSPQTASAVAVQLDFCRRLMRAQDRQGLQPWCPQRSLNFLGGQATHCASPPLPSPQSCKARGWWRHGCGEGTPWFQMVLRESVPSLGAHWCALGAGKLQQHHTPGETTRGTLLPPTHPSLPPLRPGWDPRQQSPAGTPPYAAQLCSVSLLGATHQRKLRISPAKGNYRLLLVLP